jgi:hypothetical protein
MFQLLKALVGQVFYINVWIISTSIFQFRCFKGQFLRAGGGDVILATIDSLGDSETFYIETNNRILHMRLLNGTYMHVFLLLSISSCGMTTVGHCDLSDVIKNNQLNLQNHQET